MPFESNLYRSPFEDLMSTIKLTEPFENLNRLRISLYAIDLGTWNLVGAFRPTCIEALLKILSFRSNLLNHLRIWTVWEFHYKLFLQSTLELEICFFFLRFETNPYINYIIPLENFKWRSKLNEPFENLNCLRISLDLFFESTWELDIFFALLDQPG